MTNMSKEAMKLALEALKMCRGVIRNSIENLVPVESPNPWFSQDVDQAITALREALAEQPAQRKPLTDEQIEPIAIDVLGYGALCKEDMKLFTQTVRAIEVVHGIKGDA